MNGKKPSWLLRAGSFLLAALMVFGNLYLPSGFLKASAEETSTTLFSTDFEDDAIGPISMDNAMYSGSRGWHINTSLSDNVSFGVTEVNGNKVLAITKADATETSTFEIKFDLQDGNNPDSSITYAELSYNIALTANMQMFFPAICNSSGYTRSAHFGSNGGSLVYQPQSGGWTPMFSDGANLQPNKWYTVKQTYKLAEGENAAEVEVWIDGVKTLTTIRETPADISGFVMQLYKSSAAGSVYIDNIQFTTVNHTPAATPVPVVNEVLYKTDFEADETQAYQVGDFKFDKIDLSEGSDPTCTNYSNWAINAYAQNSSLWNIGIEKHNENQVLVMTNQCAADGSGSTASKVMLRRNGITETEVWMSYNVALSSLTTAATFPAPAIYGGYKIEFGVKNGQWVYNGNNAITYKDGSALPSFKANTWYNVELHFAQSKDGETVNTTVEVWIDGKLTNVATNNSAAMDGSGNSILHLMMHLDKTGTGETKMYLDNLQVSALEHTPAEKPAALVVDTPEKEVYLETGFETVDEYATGKAITATDSNWRISLGSAITSDSTKGGVSIQKINGNQVLVLNNVCDYANAEAQSGRIDTKIRLAYNNLGVGDEAYVTFYAAVSTKTTAAFFPAPVLSGGAEGAYYGINGGSGWRYQDGLWDNSKTAEDARYEQWDKIYLNGTTTVPTAEVMKWYQIKLHYVNGADGGTVELWIDGQKMNNITYGVKSGSFVGLIMELNHWGSGETALYIDNLKVSSKDHEPAAAPASLVVETAEPESYYTQNFEDVAVTDGIGTSPLTFGDTSSGTNKDVGFRVKVVTGKDGNTENKALEVYYTNDAYYGTNSDGTKLYDRYSQLVNVQGVNENQVEKAVLEYDLYYSDGAATIYPLALRSNYGFGMQLVLEGSGKLRTNTGMETIKQLTKNEWHHIKIVGDSAADKWYIWVDGEYIPLVNNGTNGNVSGFRGVYMTTYHNQDATKPQNIFFDNIEYYEYIPATEMTVDKTTVSLDVNDNKTAQLNVTFGGEYVSLPVATFTSNNTDVVTVDANGLITAVGAGETTITVTAAGETSLTQTVNVAVTGVAGPKVYYSEDFNDETVGHNVLAITPVFHSADTSAANAAYYTVQNAAVGGSTTNYLRIDEAVTDGAISVGIRPWTDGTLGKAVLQYKLYFPNGTEGTYPLQFFSSQQNAKLAMLILEPGGYLKYQPHGSTTNIMLATLSADTWHDIKLVMDVTNSRWYLYVDNEFVANVSGFKGEITNMPYIRGLALDTWNNENYDGGHNATGVAYDDIIVSEYIPVAGMTVTETTVGMKTGETYQLNVSFTGDDASAPVATYTVDNSNVISVDHNGKINALGVGTAKITVTHPDLPNVSYTVNVTVEKNIVTDPVIYYSENFNNVVTTDGIGAAPSPMTTDALGFRVKEFTDAQNNVQKALEVYYEEPITNKRYTAQVILNQRYPVMVLEYKLYYTDGAATMFAPSLRGTNYTFAQSIVLEGGGRLRTDVGQETIVQLEKDKWHDIKIVGDVNAGKWYIWVDNVYYPLVNNNLLSGNTAFTGFLMQTFHNSGAAVPSNIYFDDIKLYQPITTTGMTVTNDAGSEITSATVLDLKANEGEEYNLNVSFTPANGSSNAAVFSTSDATVADVDIYGTIYAKGAGTATITIASVLGDVDPIEVTVNVTGVYAPKPIIDETFQNATEGTTGGAIISGSETAYGYVYEKNNGNKLFQVSSNDTNAHGYASFPFLNDKGSRVSYSDKVYASYWMAVDDLTGIFYIPMLASSTAGGQCAVIASKTDGTFEYTTNGNDWTDVTYTDGTPVSIKANEWVLVEIVFDNGSLAMEFNNKPVNFKYNGQDAVNAFTMQMSKWMNAQVAYIDNIKISVTEHEPYGKPDEDLQVGTEGVYFVDADGNAITALTINAKTPTELKVAFDPLGATDRTVSFVSSDTDVADFNSNGALVGYKSGTTKITATLDSNKNIKAELLLTVNVVDVTDVTITSVDLDAVSGEEDTYTLVTGDHGFATAQITPANASYSTIIWSSSNTAVAIVDSYGEIVALSAGTTVIKATSEDGTSSDSITVVVTEPDSEKATTYNVRTVDELKQALAAIATINSGAGMEGNIYIVLEGGYYYLTETLKLGVEHSGTNGYSVIIKAKDTTKAPVISGASVIEGEWTEVEGKGYYSIQVDKNVDSRHLFVNNVRATRARREGGLTDVKELFDDQARSIGFISADTDLLDIPENRREDLEIVFKEQWTQPRIGVTSVTDNGDGTVNLVLDQPGWSGIGGIQSNSVSNKGGTSATAKAIVWIENALELLDEPGEWYLDTHSSEAHNILYYMPRAWEDLDNAYVTMPTLDNSIASEGGDGALVEISGTFVENNYNEVEKQVQNIHFEGITFADTTWMRPSSNQGVSDAQNNHIRESGDVLAPGAVLVQAANCIWFTDCTFTRLGINGLQMINGVQNSFIIGNHFFDISGNAINIGEPDTGTANAYAQGLNTMKNDDILNNFIHNVGVDYGSSAAISVGFAADMDMNHNEIFDIPYSGWHIGYGWNSRFNNNNKNMLLEYNFVHDFMDQDIFDGSAFYTLGNMSGEGYNDGYSFIRWNYIRNQMNAHGALYPDQGTTYLKLVENVIDLSETESWASGAPKWSHTNQMAMHVHYINNFSTTDYKTYSTELDFKRDDIQFGTLNISADASWTDPVALKVIENAGLEAAYNSLRNGQVERFEVFVDGEENDGSEKTLEVGENIQLSYTVGAIREGDVVTSGLNYKQYYQSQDTSVVTVDENGKITAVGRGIANVYVWVVSNNVIDMEKITVVVADVADYIRLDGVDSVVSMSTESNWQLTATIISELGRELTPDSVTYAVADKSVATVDANGLMLPVAVGETTLTVTAVYNGVSVSDIFKVEITEPSDVKTVNAAELFDADLEHLWVMNGASNWELVDDTSVTGKFSSYATFGGAEYGNELLSFKLKIDGSGSWPSIVLRAQGLGGEVNSGAADGYIFCMGPNGIEAYRFVDGVRYVIRGNQEDNGTTVIRLEGYKGVVSPAESGFVFTNNVAEYNIKVGAINDGGNVRILLYVEDKLVIDFVDKIANGAIDEPGYFGMIGRGQTFTLTKNTNIADEVDTEESEINAAQIGDKTFTSVDAAMAVAQEGDTVELMADQKLESLFVREGIALDLNGYELDVDYLITFGSDQIIDSAPGAGLIKCKEIVLDKNNKAMPVWDEAAGGYRLFPILSQQMYRWQKSDSFEFIAKPALNSAVNDLFMAQSETNGLTIKIRMSWTTGSGNEVEQSFILKPEDMKEVYSVGDNIVQLNVTGAAPYVNRLSTTTYIVSETGVEWMPVGELYVGQ